VITAVDTNVLLDVLRGDGSFGAGSVRALRRCGADGGLIACEVVWAELASQFQDKIACSQAMDQFGVAFDELGVDAAMVSGLHHRSYRAGGGPKQRIVADFLIGSHAQLQADQLLTRDRGFYRTYFSDLLIVDPMAG
jgi:predicted nucleic acid-binding protein